MKHTITKEARIVQIAQGARASDIDASVQLAIKSLQAQIQSFYKLLTELKKTDNANTDSEGRPRPGAGAPTLLTLVNRSGAGRNYGDVVARDPAHERSFTVTTKTGDPAVIGVVYSDSPDGAADAVPVGAEGRICAGGLARVRVDANHAPIETGDFLVAHTTPGVAARARSREDTGAFAVALEPIVSGVGLIAAVITSAALVTSESVAALKNFDHSLFERDGFYRAFYDDDGAATGFSGCLTSASLWTSPTMSQLVGRWTFRYGAGGELISSIHSAYDLNGDGLATVRRAIQYQQDRVAEIIADLA